ncbi:MAG: CPBP family intramembrane metalloprotease [Parcubacteria group bacterium]|nr:CPBP family intramembrane metalloprotease [Parcubacteria group bacterium]
MNTPIIPSVEIQTPSTYRDVSRTNTYHIYLTIPLFLIYTVGNSVLNAGAALWIINGAEKTLYDIGTLFGVLPQTTAAFLLALCVSGALYRDRKKYGFMGLPRPSFVFLTLIEALFGGLAVMMATSWLTGIVFYLLAGHTEMIAAQSEPLSVLQAIHAFGSGFYEELLYRVILLAGALSLLRLAHVPGALARVTAVVFVSVLSAWTHYAGPLQDSFTVYPFLYRVYGEMFFSAIFLWRGFTTAAWSHTVFDIAVHL